MIADLKPYPEYRSAEGQWLGKVPVHWAVRRFKYILREKDSRSVGGKEQLLRVSQFTGVTQRLSVNGLDEPDTRAASLVGYKCVNPDDLVINIMLAWNGSLGVSRYDGIASPAYCVYRFGEVAMPWYYHHLLRSPAYKARIKALSTGVVESRLRLYTDDLFRLEALLPPPDEQAAIVRFLNHTNQRIERTIRAKRKVIALLNEQKQVIIHRAVTRGLDPNVRLKPSGIPWLGEVPEGWETRRVKHCITPVEQGWSPQCDAQPAGENEWGVLKVGCVNKDFFNGSQNKKLPKSLLPVHALEIRDGDILVSRANTRELLGLAALAENPRPKLMLCDKLFRFRPRSCNFNAKFLVLSLRDKLSRDQIEVSTNGASASMQNIGQGVLKNLWVSIPPIEEQIQIIAKINEETQQLTKTIDRTEREISLLREYRTRLIADVVTGKLDVREAAARLPDEVDSLDSTDGTDFVDTEDLDDSCFVDGGDDGNTAA
jgi:type I restriction enzyme, S subunit